MIRRPKTPPPTPPQPDERDLAEMRMSLLGHLEELRDRLVRSAIALVIGTTIGLLIAGQVFQFLLQPYGRLVQVLDPTGSVTNYFRVGLLVGGILAIPVITYQLMAFIVPGLTRRERRIVLTALPAITLLFVIGVVFTWYILIPPALNFLATFQQEIFIVEWTAEGYLGFVTALLFWMGAAFQMPLVFFVLAFIGIVRARVLIHQWRIAVVAIAAAAAVITPTVDPVNMLLVMAPLLALYLLSILLVVIGQRLNRGEGRNARQLDT